MNYYNEIDAKASAWLRNMIAADLIPRGEVDQRSITDVQAKDLEGFTSCHFFAGIGGWPIALRLAGWPDKRPVWTGSCPCQSYSVAGKQKGNDDPRNLWPHFFRLIRECRPDVCFGEQVENAIRHGWLDGIHADMEGEGYAVGHCVLGAHSVGAPHIRQRLYWVAQSSSAERGWRGESAGEHGGAFHAANGSGLDRLADTGRAPGSTEHGNAEGERADCAAAHPAGIRSRDAVGMLDYAECPVAGLRDGQERSGEVGRNRPTIASPANELGLSNGTRPYLRRIACTTDGHGDSIESAGGNDGTMGDAGGQGLSLPERQELPGAGRINEGRDSQQPGGPWGSYYVAHCRDGKARRVGTGIQPLAHGVPRSVGHLRARLESLGIDSEHIAPKMLAKLLASARSNRVTRLRGYGNAIVPSVAAEFVLAFMGSV